MRKEEKRRIELPDLPDEAKSASENADSVKGGVEAPDQKGILFFDEADALFGSKGVKKQLP